MRKNTFVLIIVAILAISMFDSVSAKMHPRYHIENGGQCYISADGVHHPASYDTSSLEILIRQNKKTIQTAEDIVRRAGSEKLKAAAQGIIDSRKKEREQLDLLRNDLLNK